MKKVKVKLLTSLAGASGTHPAGSVLETSPAEAASFVKAGFAVFVEPIKRKKAAAKVVKKEAPEVEEATNKDFVKRETTAGRKPRLRKRK